MNDTETTVGRPQKSVTWIAGRNFTLKEIETRRRNLKRPICRATLISKANEAVTAGVLQIVGKKATGKKGRQSVLYKMIA